MPAARPQHSYRTCRDPDCGRLPCLAYRDGYDDGYDDGFGAAAGGGDGGR